MKKLTTQEIHASFASQAGAHAIATPINIEAIIDYCQSTKLRRVLEIGGGIGTLTFTVLSYSDAIIEVYEDSSYCRKKLRANLVDWRDRFQVIDSYDHYPSASEYDLVIVDGPDCNSLEERDRKTSQVLSPLRSVGCFFIEGSRYSQRRIAQQKMAESSLYSLRRVKGRKVGGLGLVKGGLFVERGRQATKITGGLCYVFWFIYDLADLKDPRRRMKVFLRFLSPGKTLVRFCRNIIKHFRS